MKFDLIGRAVATAHAHLKILFLVSFIVLYCIFFHCIEKAIQRKHTEKKYGSNGNGSRLARSFLNVLLFNISLFGYIFFLVVMTLITFLYDNQPLVIRLSRITVEVCLKNSGRKQSFYETAKNFYAEIYIFFFMR